MTSGVELQKKNLKVKETRSYYLKQQVIVQEQKLRTLFSQEVLCKQAQDVSVLVCLSSLLSQ